jgi:rSAM/selenodomain-associated transferase 1
MAEAERRRPALSSTFAPRLIVMAKSPAAGRVKRRLSREIGMIGAIGFYRACLANTLARLQGDPRWDFYVAISPDRDAFSARLRRSRAKLLAQGGGDLGTRMQRIFASLPPGPAIIVGGDIPAISASSIAQAFRLLGNADAVFGAAPDGGYWLVGLKRTPRLIAPFASVRWSSQHALADTLANLEGKHVAFAATLSDVDEGHACRSLRPQWQRLIPPAEKPAMPRMSLTRT